MQPIAPSSPLTSTQVNRTTIHIHQVRPLPPPLPHQFPTISARKKRRHTRSLCIFPLFKLRAPRLHLESSTWSHCPPVQVGVFNLLLFLPSSKNIWRSAKFHRMLVHILSNSFFYFIIWFRSLWIWTQATSKIDTAIHRCLMHVCCQSHPTLSATLDSS
jgi:hypothetical protein